MPTTAGNSVPPVHVLFVHGVGRHSKLSSLLRPYQSLRSQMLSDEAPVESEDPFKRWTLADFDDADNPVFLKLVSDNPDEPDIHLYEVNYSTLAGIVRANQPLDLTHLLVSLDLAVSVARQRLVNLLGDPEEMKKGNFNADELRGHIAFARVVQRLTGVFVAATVPVLGLPSIVLRKYVAQFVADFTRFFEDVATFALDRNGSALIRAHFDHTVREIDKKVGNGKFIVVAHSLGSVVAHSYLVSAWRDASGKGNYSIPHSVVTLGSPIGIVSWMWRFLDFKGARFDPSGTYKTTYFCWTPLEKSLYAGRTLEWINVVNYLDPIATAFPLTDTYLGMQVVDIAKFLSQGMVQPHYIRTGGLLSAGRAHTQYFQDKKNFLRLLGKVIPLYADKVPPPPSLDPVKHWRDSRIGLRVCQVALWAAGLACLAGYFLMLADIAGLGARWKMLFPFPFALYVLPWFTIGTLAFFQRLLVSSPTKRTSAEDAAILRPWRIAGLPYWILRWLPIPGLWTDPAPDKAASSWVWVLLKQAFSFLPTLVAMAFPLWWIHFLDETYYWRLDLAWRATADFFAKAGWTNTLVLIALFVAYTVFFAASELARHWGRVVRICRAPARWWRC